MGHVDFAAHLDDVGETCGSSTLGMSATARAFAVTFSPFSRRRACRPKRAGPPRNAATPTGPSISRLRRHCHRRRLTLELQEAAVMRGTFRSRPGRRRRGSRTASAPCAGPSRISSETGAQRTRF